VFSLSLPAWAISEVGSSKTRCHSWSSSVFTSANHFILCLPLKLCNWIQNLNDNKVKLSEHFICLILVCDVFYVITSVMTLVMILVRTNHHCLKVGRHICSNEARALLKNIRQLTNIMYDWRKGREEKTRLWFTLLVAYQLIFLFYFYVLYSFS
jgi:hypothetical protein